MSVTTFEGPPAGDEPGIGALTLSGFLDEVVARWGDRPALVFEGRVPGRGLRTRIAWSYRELHSQARALARGLLADDMPPGAHVALLMGQRPEWVAAAFAVALAGGVLVPVNTFLEPLELAYVLRHCDAGWLLGQPELAGHSYIDTVDATDLPDLCRTVWLDDRSWAELVDAGRGVGDDELDQRASAVSPLDDALLLYTSGTTATPKAILHRHRAPALQSWRFARQLGIDDTVRTWSAFPFFWAAGFCMVLGATLAAGGRVVLQETFNAGEALRIMESERVTTPHAWPHQLESLEDHPDWLVRDLSAIRHAEEFGCFARHPTVHDLRPWSPRAAYGTSETFTIVSSTPADTPAADREGHHGEILPGNVVRIADGEITVKGPTLMRGYYKQAPETGFDADGFFHTGDAGFVDESGHLHWTGRMSGLIKTGGANVSPVEIETELLRHPLLKAALAVGIPHETLGEIVVVAAIPHARADVDEDAVRWFLRGRLASYKIPRRVVFFADGELELTGNAKIRTEDLRRVVSERLNAPP